MAKKLVLATTSIPRKQAFDELQIPYEAIGSGVDENFKGKPETPKALVYYLARLKAEAVAKKRPDSIVIGFDSVAYYNEEILEKPKSKNEAFKRLQNFSGNSYKFFTGIRLIDNDYSESELVRTEALVREISDNEINKYLNQDPNFRRYAQGFDPLNTYGATFIKEIEGCYNNIIREIPLEKIIEMIKRRGFEIN